ncbi:YciI family protein [Kribbella sancticallisti]|uniref:YciI family protein n=1 Tax=Kribbella sancticallisti TaxID=460087 RepID=A0ABN2CNQ9_9ACTN
MTQYLLAVQLVDGEPAPPDDGGAVDALNQEMVDQGVWVFGGGLQARSTRKVVRVEAGEVLVTDGPFAESKEYMAGFWVIKAPDLETAQGWAAKATKACQVPIEVSPFDPADG